MDIIISNSSGRPIYDQISEQIKEKILTGQLEEGEALPLSLIHILSSMTK